jgi:hypothetical protein
MIASLERIAEVVEEAEDEGGVPGLEDGWYSWYRKGEVITFPVDGEMISAKLVDSFGGMDQGSTLYIILEIEGRLYRKDGYYQSWTGSSWEGDFYEVTAKPVVTTGYERI